LLSYLRDDCHKQAVLISESRGDSNRYTPCRGKSDSHATRFSMLDSHMVPNHTSPVVHVGNLSLVPTRMKHAPTPGEVMAIKDRLSQLSSWVTSFPHPRDSLGLGEIGFGQVVIQLHQLTGPITPACDRYVQYLLVGANPSVLN
jgi:hypothetical protein